MIGTVGEMKAGKFPDLFLLCSDTDFTLKQWNNYEIVRLHFNYPKPHAMLAIIFTEEEARLWQEKAASGARSVRQ